MEECYHKDRYQSLSMCISYLVDLPIGAVSYQLNQFKDASRILERQRKHDGIRINRTNRNINSYIQLKIVLKPLQRMSNQI